MDAIWLSPFYPSALVDGGYDVDDYRDVDPTIGTLEQFDRLVAALHARDIKVIVDIVPNHSSNRHAWFEAALASPPGSPERDRYIFRDGTGPNGDEPPADWVSFFGGPAWTRVPDGQWYLHLFTREQPDWNWGNDDVRHDFLRTLKFWGDRGVDGFRVDVANLLAKDLPAVLPTWTQLMAGLAPDSADYPPGQHPIWDRDDVDDIYREWRKLFDTYSPPLTAVAEAWVAPDRRVRYAAQHRPGPGVQLRSAAGRLGRGAVPANHPRQPRARAREPARRAHGSFPITTSSATRPASRLPTGTSASAWLLAGADPTVVDPALGLRRARAATLLALALPGSMYLYQGEELGLAEVTDIPDARKQDPAFFRDRGSNPGRDGCRVPLPWKASGRAFGFGSGAPHLPQPAWFAQFSVDVEEADAESTLLLYRRALALRRLLRAGEAFEWMSPDDPDDPPADEQVVSFRRNDDWASVTNFGSTPIPLPLGTVLISSNPLQESTRLPGATTVWMRLHS